jgi:hypothetical protein
LEYGFFCKFLHFEKLTLKSSEKWSENGVNFQCLADHEMVSIMARGRDRLSLRMDGRDLPQ